MFIQDKHHRMNFKLERTDLYLILLYFVFAVPIGLLDWDYDNWQQAVVERATFIFLNATTIYVIVFVLIARLLPGRRFILLFVLTIIFLIIMGMLSLQMHCSIFDCSGNPLSFEYILAGFNARINEIGLLAAMIAGKKMLEAQIRFFKMEKEKKESELQALKSQIDPHFLFNNLNTLDALIDQQPVVAKAYLHRLAQLYRYLIANKDLEVVPLSDELDFARNYIYLIECRYERAFQFDLSPCTARQGRMLIPPGALQTLLENIVKHNEASSPHPILTRLMIGEDRIVLTNDLRPKQVQPGSSGIGLQNLKRRYALLTDQPVRIITGDTFSVQLPLIKEVE